MVTKRGSPKFNLHKGDVKFKQIRKFDSVSSLKRGDEKSDTEIRKLVRIIKYNL